MIDRLIPDGPLHSGLARDAFAGGALITLASLALPGAKRYARFLCGAFAVWLAARRDLAPDAVWDALGHDARTGFVVTTAAGLAPAALAFAHPRFCAAALLVAAALSWGTVPDTEWPLAVGGGLAAVGLVEVLSPAARGLLRRAGFALSGLLIGAGAGIGARGMPDRVWPTAIALAATGAVGAGLTRWDHALRARIASTRRFLGGRPRRRRG